MDDEREQTLGRNPSETSPPTSSTGPTEEGDFTDLRLDESVQSAISKLGWKTPTPVQNLCLPFTLEGRDVAGFAQTGTGKTGVFLMTIAQMLMKKKPETKPSAIVLVPTRELAVQIVGDAQEMFEALDLTVLGVYGGVDYEKQARRLKEGVEIVVATPGRLKDYCQQKIVDLKNISIFVCDEADRMFDMGFVDDVEFFLERIDEQAQKLLFSATTNENVKELAFEYLENPEYISVNPEVITPETIEQHAIHCNSRNKLKVLLGYLKDENPDCAIIFTNTKLTAEWLHFKLQGNGVDADIITGDLPQKKRIRMIQKIKAGKIKALIATDVASRGLHISRVTHVFNFDLPDEAANYVHRVGRTARAGAKGKAFSLVCEDYGHNLNDINELLGEDASIATEWYDEAYLNIEDKAGNPFAKPKEDRAEQQDRGGRDRDGRDRDGRDRKTRDRDTRQRRGASQSPAGQRRRPPRKGQKPKSRTEDTAKHRDARTQAPQRKSKKRQDRSRKRPSRDSSQPSAKPQPSDASQAPSSVGGILRAIIKTLIGRKKTDKT